MDFQDVAFLPPELVFFQHFIKIMVVDSLVTTTCLEAIVEDWQEHATCKILCANKASFLHLSNFMVIMEV